MIRIRTTALSLLLAAAAGAALTGCADQSGTGRNATAEPAGPGAAGTAAASAPTAATAGSAPADAGTDAAIGWVEGKVTRGGTGPCYGLLDLNGVEYAMYSAEGRKLAAGDRIRAQLKPATLRIHCGAGKPVQADAIQPLG